MKNKILIIGSSGFIGRNLKEFLEKSDDLYEIDSPDSTEFDISDETEVRERLQTYGYDIILHAAVYNPRTSLNKDESKELEQNLRMFYNFERYQNLYGRMYYFGSGAEFDKSGEIINIEEDNQGNGIPQNTYGLYKYIINKAIKSSDNIYNLRVFGLFGKYENWKVTFISGACCKALKDLPITIRQNVYFDYLYVEDFCKIVKWFIENNVKHREYNITSGSKIDLVTIANIVNKVTKKELPIYIGIKGLANEYSASNKKLVEELGKFSFTSMEDAVADLYKWYKNHEENIDLYSLLYQ